MLIFGRNIQGLTNIKSYFIIYISKARQKDNTSNQIKSNQDLFIVGITYNDISLYNIYLNILSVEE